MKKFIKISVLFILVIAIILVTCGFASTSSRQDSINTISIGDKLSGNQPTPNDINYSLERYNLIKRAYWVNGQREKAVALPCAVERPLGYIVLLTESGSIVGKFVVDGKVSSLNSYLTPDSQSYEGVYVGDTVNKWLPDVDGSYGTNDNGIFFFTPDGKYIEWTGIYLYSDIPFEISSPIITYSEGK